MATAEDFKVFPSDTRPPLAEVIADFEQERAAGHAREAAELAYAVAMRLQAEGRVQDASVYAQRCLSLLQGLPSSTVDQVTSTRMKAGGINLPELLHEDVVLARLGHLIPS